MSSVTYDHTTRNVYYSPFISANVCIKEQFQVPFLKSIFVLFQTSNIWCIIEFSIQALHSNTLESINDLYIYLYSIYLPFCKYYSIILLDRWIKSNCNQYPTCLSQQCFPLAFTGWLSFTLTTNITVGIQIPLVLAKEIVYNWNSLLHHWQ